MKTIVRKPRRDMHPIRLALKQFQIAVQEERELIERDEDDTVVDLDLLETNSEKLQAICRMEEFLVEKDKYVIVLREVIRDLSADLKMIEDHCKEATNSVINDRSELKVSKQDVMKALNEESRPCDSQLKIEQVDSPLDRIPKEYLDTLELFFTLTPKR